MSGNSFTIEGTKFFSLTNRIEAERTIHAVCQKKNSYLQWGSYVLKCCYMLCGCYVF